jgi:hypothetical protein
MNPNLDPHQKLERLIHQTLRELPPRRAPASLEARVLAEVARRIALPWWRKSYAHWPVAARAAFLVLSFALAGLSAISAVWFMGGVDLQAYLDGFALQFAWLQNARAVIEAVRSFADIVARNIPPLWIYGAFAVVAATYFTLFGLGAAAYRALQPRHAAN